MSLWNLFFPRRAEPESAPLARERLQILLTHERTAGGDQSDLVTVLREEVLAAIQKHVAVDPNNVEVKLERGKAMSVLEIDVEIPNHAARAAVIERPQTPNRAMKKRMKRAAAVRKGLSVSSA